MKLLLFTSRNDTKSRLGILTQKGIIDVAQVAANNQLVVPSTIQEAIENKSDGLDTVVELAEAFLEESEVDFLPCVTHPEKIICIGLNYQKHAEETGAEIPTSPVVFSKFNNSLAAHQEVIPILEDGKQYDFEAELGVIIGRMAKNINVDQALDYVYGYCPTNDISVRDLQFRTSQWLLGKTLDKALPVGPYMVTASEVSDPQDLSLATWVNGERRQNSTTSDMIFSVAEIISYLSKYMTLNPGDLISTGTPQGVIAGMKEPAWLSSGDVVDVEIQGLGRLSNRFE